MAHYAMNQPSAATASWTSALTSCKDVCWLRSPSPPGLRFSLPVATSRQLGARAPAMVGGQLFAPEVGAGFTHGGRRSLPTVTL